jgi:hypothetical protein
VGAVLVAIQSGVIISAIPIAGFGELDAVSHAGEYVSANPTPAVGMPGVVAAVGIADSLHSPIEIIPTTGAYAVAIHSGTTISELLAISTVKPTVAVVVASGVVACMFSPLKTEYTTVVADGTVTSVVPIPLDGVVVSVVADGTVTSLVSKLLTTVGTVVVLVGTVTSVLAIPLNGAFVVVVAAGTVVTEISEFTDNVGEVVTVEAVGVTVSSNPMSLTKASVVVVAVGITVSRTLREGDITAEDAVAAGVTL